MPITREQFTDLMIQYGFARFPRTVGNPLQTVIHDFNSFILFYKLNNGRFPLYTSTNSYWDFDKYGNPTNVYYEKMFHDLDMDTGFTVNDALKDSRKMAMFCKDHKIPFVVSFSGNGFHPYLFFEPKMRTIDTKLTQEIRGIQSHLKEELDIKTMNLVCAEPRRMVRIPLSRYVTGKEMDGWTPKDRYCIPLTYNQLMNNSLKEIMLLSKHPRLLNEPYKMEGNKIKLKNFIKDHKVDVKRYVEIERQGHELEGTVDYTLCQDKDMFKMVELLIPWSCLNRMLWNKNPPHFIRFSACAFLVNVMSMQEAVSLFDKIAYDAEWNDRHNKMVRDYHISHIYKNQYRPYSCEELERHGVCVGEECPRYAKYIKKKSSTNGEVLDDSKKS